ncbi:MAG: hypothetical protein HQL07_01290 [Nitrospirae bacterium]|nr:hypothetical protein [Magnetococcales bacterium]HAT51498.1 hypothetical protein [Alphaproteobacteria bacterium]
MTLIDQIHEQARDLPEAAAAEVLDFIGYLRLKLGCQCIDDTPSHFSGGWSNPARPWDAKAFLDCCAGSIPDFPDIEDEGPLQERAWIE